MCAHHRGCERGEDLARRRQKAAFRFFGGQDHERTLHVPGGWPCSGSDSAPAAGPSLTLSLRSPALGAAFGERRPQCLLHGILDDLSWTSRHLPALETSARRMFCRRRSPVSAACGMRFPSFHCSSYLAHAVPRHPCCNRSKILSAALTSRFFFSTYPIHLDMAGLNARLIHRLLDWSWTARSLRALNADARRESSENPPVTTLSKRGRALRDTFSCMCDSPMATSLQPDSNPQSCNYETHARPRPPSHASSAHVLRWINPLSANVHVMYQPVVSQRARDFERGRQEGAAGGAPQGRRGMKGADAHQFTRAAAQGRREDLTRDQRLLLQRRRAAFAAAHHVFWLAQAARLARRPFSSTPPVPPPACSNFPPYCYTQ
jgi:hypothetical protein